MAIQKKHEQLWQDAESGLVVPAGIVSDLSQSSSQTYLEIKEKAKTIEKLYTDNDLFLPPTCDLVRLIGDAKALSDS